MPGLERRAVFLKVRSKTKTGERTVPALVGHVVDGLRGLNKQFCRPEDPLFCDYKGDVVPLVHLRFHFNDVVERWGFKRFHLTFYSFRHFYATEALRRGVSTSLVSRALGTSEKNVQEVYGHLLLTDESLVRQLYKLPTA